MAPDAPLGEQLESPLRVLALERLLEVGAGAWLDEPQLARFVTALEDDVRACLRPLVRTGWLEHRGDSGPGSSWRVPESRREAVAHELKDRFENGPPLLSRLRAVQSGQMGELVGYDPRMKMVFEKARIASRSTVPVLLEGASGTGKSVVAGAIHELGAGRGRYLSAHALQLPAGGIDALLTRGAGGTIYLQGLGHLPSLEQDRLLRALNRARQDPGGVTWRLISATEQPVANLVAEGTLSADLSRRLDVFRIRIPTLSERIDDLPLMAEQLRARAANKHGVPPTTGITDSGLAALRAHDWPGNLRELEGVILAAALRTEAGRSIDGDAIRTALRSADSTPAPTTSTSGPVIPLEQVIQDALLNALKRHAGNVTAAARELDISKVTLYRRLERFAPDPQSLLDSFRD